MLGHTKSLNKLTKIEIISNIFSNHNSTEVEINRRKTGNLTNMWKLNNTFPKNQWVKGEIKRGENLRQMKLGTQYTKTYGIVLSYVHSFTIHILSNLKGSCSEVNLAYKDTFFLLV